MFHYDWVNNLADTAAAPHRPAMATTTRSMSWFGGLFHLPVATGPYSVSAADIATAATSDSRGVFLRLFYPRNRIRPPRGPPFFPTCILYSFEARFW